MHNPTLLLLKAAIFVPFFTLGTAFSNLTTVGDYLYICSNDALTSLGTAFSTLATIIGRLTIYSNGALTTLNTAFSSLTTVGDYLSISTNSALTNRIPACWGGRQVRPSL